MAGCAVYEPAKLIFCTACRAFSEGPVCYTHAQRIRDTSVIPYAVASLPDVLFLDERAVFAKKTIPALTVFGPLVGALTAEPPSEFAFVCHNAGDDGTRYFQLDSDATSNWMKYVRFARNADERNVTVCEVPASAFPDVGSDAPSLVIFMTTRIILPNEELKVGYSRGYSEVVQRLRARHTVLLDVAGATELHHQDIAASLPHSQPEAAASQRLISEDNQERSSDADGTNVCGAIWYSAVMPTPSELAVTVLKHFQARRRRTEMSAASPWLEQSESVQLPSGLTAHVQRVISKCTDQRANADRCTVSTGTQTDVVPCPLGETTYDDGDDSAQPPRNVHCRPGLPHRQSVHSDVSMEFESAKTRLPVKQMKKLRRGARAKKRRGRAPSPGRLPCDVCGKLYRSRKILRVHKRDVHYGDRSLQCDECGQLYASPASLNKHKHWVHIGDAQEKLNREYKKERGIPCYSATYVNPRKRLPLEQFPFRCDECQLGYMREITLIKHIETRHPEQVEGSS